MIYFFNGNYLSSSELKLSPNDLAITRGYGIFDYFRTYNRTPFHPEAYISRFINSASIAQLPLRWNKEEILEIIFQLIEKNNSGELGIRLLLTGGYSKDNYTSENPNFFILAEEVPSVSFKPEEGLKLFTYNYQREWPEAKLINYSTAIILRSKWQLQEYEDLLYHKNNFVTEAPRSNFFVVKNNEIITAGKGVLKGITRACVINLAKPHYKVVENNYPVKLLPQVEEAFITNSSKGIIPVTAIDKNIIASGRPGKITAHLISLWQEYTEKSPYFFKLAD